MQNRDKFQIDPETTTVGDVVAQNFNAADIFRQYGLDFCCGGGVPIKTACEKKKVDSAELMNQLHTLAWNSTLTDQNYQAWETGHLIDHIVSVHHQFVRTKVEEIPFYASKVAHVHGERHPENVEIYEQFIHLARELVSHLEAEENRVFPLIEEVYSKRMTGEPVSEEQIAVLCTLLDEMVDDHVGAGSVMASIRELSRNYTPPEGACTTYRILYQNLEAFEEDLHKHVHLENNILFKKAEKLVGKS